MEDLRPGSSSASTDTEEDDEFYEEIEAPKFVDFTTPDQSRPDDRSWFCARVGCDQSHEEVDPDALYRSFKIRIMAARSPNIRFQRALQHQTIRTPLAKCPHSAPALRKPMARISSVTSISEKMAMAKLKRHQISSLRETTSQSIEKLQMLHSEKANPTTRKKDVGNKETPSAVNAAKSKEVDKSLFLQTPNKAVKKKLNIDGEKRHAFEGSSMMSSMKDQRTCVTSTKKIGDTSKGPKSFIIKDAREDGIRFTESYRNQIKDTSGKDQGSTDRKMGNDSKESVNPNKIIAKNLDGSQASNGRRGGNGRRALCYTPDDENKENLLVIYENRDMTSNTATLENKKIPFDASKKPPTEEAKVRIKPFKEHSWQRRKLMKITNPKPFRLRTDERGILKEANLERKLQAESKKESASLIKHLDRLERQETNRRTKLMRLPEGKNNQVCMVDKRKEKQQFVARVCKEEESLTKLPKLKRVETKGYAGCVQGRKSATIPREPKFHRIHVPKCCTKRSGSEMAIS